MDQPEKRKIRLVVVGDEFVGKTTLISAIISQMPVNGGRTMKKVILPPDMCKFSQQIFTQIIDTSATQTNFHQQLNKSDLVILVYDITCQNSIERLSTHWLPLIKHQVPHIPIILVGNKYDQIQKQDKSYKSSYGTLKNLAPDFRQIQIGLQCSGLYDHRVKQMLNCAQRAVLYPLSPLYDIKDRALTPTFQKALSRIFRILDKDLDGKLSDQQLKALQQRVFKSQLYSKDIRAIKDIIIKEQQQINDNFVTLEGFLALNKKCIEIMKIQMSWSILRYFKYNNNLELNIPQQKFYIQNGESLELTLSALTFLHNLYSYAIKKLPNNPIDFIFSCSPEKPSIAEFQLSYISLETFLYVWNYMSFIDYQSCYRYLYYIGYQENITFAFKKTTSKYNYSNLSKIKQRKIISVGFLQSPQTSDYLGELFLQSQQQEGIKRKYKIMNIEGSSKIMLLFKISNLENFYKSQLSKKLDLLVHFKDSNSNSVENLNQVIRQSIKNQYILIRQIIVKEAEVNQPKKQKQENYNCLKILSIQYINPDGILIKNKPQSYEILFKIVIKSLSKIDLCLTVEIINQLKLREFQNKAIILFGGIGAVLLGIGVYYFKNHKKI